VDALAPWSGWLGVALIVTAASVPLGHRLLRQRRAVPASRTIATHAVLGFAATAAALLHTFAVLPALGSPAAIGGGMIALAPAAVAFFVLFAHIGVGLRLRSPRLKERARFRRWHVVLATTIAVTVAAHVVALVLVS
jgi:predicted membrane-bound spermidine synthase